MKKVFIDGSEGTTGLRIRERLAERQDIELLLLNEELRKDTEARREALNSADLAFLCLPDEASLEAADMVVNPDTVIIDTSTAHRTMEGWTYGFPELTGQREKIAAAKRIANPGCHASGVIALLAPLREKGLLAADEMISIYSLTGYSGGGRKCIARYKKKENREQLRAPQVYGLTQEHKHLPEIVRVCGLERTPAFSPIISSYYAGMEVVITLFADQLKCGMEEIKALYRQYYGGPVIRFAEDIAEKNRVSADRLSGRDDMEISVYGNAERITVISRFDNLGKGASGAAVQNMNIVLGVEETAGLNLGGFEDEDN